MYFVFISCFHSILHLKAEVEGTCDFNLTLLYLYRSRENATKLDVDLKILERNVSSASFRQSFTRN